MLHPTRPFLPPAGWARAATAAVLLLATIPIEGCASRIRSADGTLAGPTAPGIRAAVSAPGRGGAPASPEQSSGELPSAFAGSVRPILLAKCAPCHEPGGKMYARLPFDSAEAVAAHADKISGRLKGGDLAALKAWVASLPAPATTRP